MYTKVLNLIKKLQPNISPKKVIIDFEKAEINAFQNVFPGIRIMCCYFHFKQCLYRHLSQIGHKTRYDNDSDFAFKINIIAALAFVPVDRVCEYFNEITSSSILNDVEEFLLYFEDNYIGRLTSGKNIV